VSSISEIARYAVVSLWNASLIARLEAFHKRDYRKAVSLVIDWSARERTPSDEQAASRVHPDCHIATEREAP
jgi:hypothetical protein